MPDDPAPTHAPSPRTRPTRRILLSLTLGLLTTLFLATIAPIALHGLLPSRWHAASPARFGSQSPTWSETLLRHYVREPFQPMLQFGTRNRAPVPHWYVYPTDVGPGIARVDTYATGFPFRTLYCRAQYVQIPRQVQTAFGATGGSNFQLHSLRGGIELSKTSDRFGIVPLSPIWSGLLLNIAIWSITAWLLLTLTSTLRTRLRTRRAGKCPHCRYDLRGLPTGAPCPECGQPRSTRT